MVENKAGVVWGGVVVALIILIIAQLIFAEKRLGGLSESFVNTFFLLECAALVFALVFLVFSFFGDVSELLQLFSPLCADAEEQEFRPLASWPLRIFVFALWVGSIIFGVSFLGVQIFPVDSDIGNFYGTGSQVSSAYYQSIPQMFGEDLVFMVALPTIGLFGLWALLSAFGVELNKVSFTVTVLLVCIPFSIGAGYLIPGFALAHEEVQGGTQNTDFFVSAATFSYFQSVIYQLTGLFLPVAHGAHNFVVSMKWFFGIALGSLALKLALFFPAKWLNRRCLRWVRLRRLHC